MPQKRKIILLCSASILASFVLYFVFRIEMIERTTIDEVLRSSDTLNRELDSLDALSQTDPLAAQDRIRELTKKDGRIALIAMADKSGSLNMATKNDALVATNYLYDAMLNDFTGNKISIPQGRRFAKRYYLTTETPSREEKKFYLFLRDTAGHRFLTVYAYRPDRRIVLRAILELLLIISINMIVGTSIYILAKKRRDHEEDDGIEAVPIELEEQVRETGIAEQAAHPDPLETAVRSCFTGIQERCNPEYVSCYIKSGADTLVKRYEWRGRSFVKAGGNEVIDLNSDAARELCRSAAILSESGKRAVLPLLHGSLLVCAVSVHRASGFTGKEIGAIRESIKPIEAPAMALLLAEDNQDQA